MSELEKGARLALEALEDYENGQETIDCLVKVEKAITALRRALEQPAPECLNCSGTGDVSGEYPGVACPECNGAGIQAQPEFIKHEVENTYDWSEWVCPDPKSYLMKCCDCGLVHEAQFGVVRYKSETEREDCEPVDDPNLQAVFRMRRSEQWSPEDTAYRPGGLPLEQPAQQEPTCKQDLQVWVIPGGNGSGQFSWEPQDERFWTRMEPTVKQSLTVDQPAQQEPVAWDDEQLQMLNFLYGAGEFDGVWFDQKHPTEKGAFWWRKHLRRLFDTRPQAREPEPKEPVAYVRNEENPCYMSTVLHERREQPEPVAKVCHDLEGHIGWNPALEELPDEGTPLYTRPPAREWVGLTDEEIEQCMKQAYATVQGRNLEQAFARAIEAKLKEKNHG